MSPAAKEDMQVAPELAAKYEAVIGLEVHVQLKTRTKAFCGCSTKFGDAPNTNTCPVCLGLPGALPVFNRKALEIGTRAGLALNCTIQERSIFARKNYFYPDLPKGYQISQYRATARHARLAGCGSRRRGETHRDTRLHLEEDAAKNLHEGFADSDKWSYIDYNRGGTPLAEIVSEPDIRTPAEAYAYLNTLKQVLQYVDASDCNMEEGSLRCDANVSVRLRGAPKFGTKVEAKNLNSFRYVADAIEYEIARQIGVIEAGGTVVAGNAAVEYGGEAHRIDALERSGARLSLLPRPGLAAVDRGPGVRGGRKVAHAGIAGSAHKTILGAIRIDAL